MFEVIQTISVINCSKYPASLSVYRCPCIGNPMRHSLMDDTGNDAVPHIGAAFLIVGNLMLRDGRATPQFEAARPFLSLYAP